jgi:DNA polymerase-3 subunit delta'
VQLGRPADRIANVEAADGIARIAAGSRPEQSLRRIEAVLACRDALDRNVAPLLAVEAMALALRAG